MDPGRSMEMDIAGRVMAAEQKLRGLYGRVSALEMRLSMSPADMGVYDDTEFVSGEASIEPYINIKSVEARIAALEASTGKKYVGRGAKRERALDLTGVIVGVSLLAIGVLLATDSFDILRNPMLAFAAGALVLGCVGLRLALK